jgi:glycosyltransferase involved in cell wall biosynthesis
MHIGVVIPAYNEAKRIGAVLGELSNKKGAYTLSVIVVDDGSRDKTAAIARKEGSHLKNLHVLRHRINLGKGAAAKTGCDAAYKLGADVIVLMDADGQHKPADLPRIIEPVLQESKTLVVGARARTGQMPFMMRFGNALLSGLTRILFGLHIGDTQSGYRAFHRLYYPDLRWKANNYAMESEMLVLAATHGIQVCEVSIATVYHDTYKGTTALDGIKVAKTLVVRRVAGMGRREAFNKELTLDQL